jgi:PASTA domain
VAMISVDNTKRPFIKRGAGYYRGGGVKGYRVPSTGVYLEGSGSGDAGMKIWKPVMQKYFQQIPRTGFSQPPRKIDVGKQVKVPSLRGLSVATATRKLERLGFTVEKRYVYSDKVPKYGFIGWSPGPGSWISEFGMVYAVYSNGRDPDVVAAEKAAKKRAQEEKRKKQQEPRDPATPTLPPIFPPRR